MKTYSFLARLGRRLTQPYQTLSARRRGTVIIIVLALLGLLALIGFFAIAFTGQENQAATYFANSPTAKNLTNTLDPDAFFNDILRQVIIGPAITEKQTVMFGGRHSLLPNMFGRDLTPFNGPGVNLIWNTATNAPAIDQNYDGNPDTVTNGQPNLMQLNFSPAAQSGNLLNFNSFSTDVTVFPDPDANITYPDNNSAYLASDTLVPNGTANPVRVITPSFHRPQVLRSLATAVNWYTSAATAPYVLFPHTYHLAIDSTGNATNQYRFVTGAFPDTSNLGTALVPYSIPGDPANAALVPPWNGGPAVQEGVWTTWSANTAFALSAQVVPIPPNGQVYSCTTAGTSSGTVPAWPTTTGGTVTDGSVVWTAIGPTNIGYDVDTDNDGIPDARYMDFGFPLMTDSSGNQFVALGAIKIIDADSLFNLNVHGNRAGLAQLPVANSFAGGNGSGSTPGEFLSLSDHGISASEVNPQWALNARPLAGTPDFTGNNAALTAALQQYVLLFRPSGSGSNPNNNFDITAGTISYELSNMEWWNLLNGRPQLAAGTPPTVSGSSFVGRWGENTTRLDPNVTQILAGTVLNGGISAPSDPFPLPGISGTDDNDNALEGGNYIDEQNIFHPAFVQPLDFFAAGSWVNYASTAPPQGKQRLLYPYQSTGTAAGNEQFPQYSQFFIPPTTQWANDLAAPTSPTTSTWNGNNGYTQISPAATITSPLITSGGGLLQIDDTDETWTEPSVAATQTSDSIFGTSENVIQMSAGDFTALGTPGRTSTLMPFNFVSNQRAALIRQRFTATSWDLKSFGKEFFGPDTTGGAGPYDARRLYEFTDTSSGATGAGPFRFPPNFVGTNGNLAPNLPPYGIIAPYTTAYDDALTPASGGSGNTTPTNAFAYPLRTATASLLQVLANPNLSTNPATGPYTTGNLPQTNLVQPQRLLSVNGLTEVYPNGQDSNGNPIYQFRFRPLTPHPSTAVSTFPSAPIVPFPPASGTSTTLPSVSWIAEPEQLASGNYAQQEWLARYDRQRMARDIYTTLYLMGGGADTPNQTPVSAFNYTTSNQPSPTTGIRPLYTDDQLAEMAQFAVNLVDALDPDSNITIFEYDKDLSDGWNLDDNAYDGTNDPIMTTHPLDRGVVYGVERQQLCLNESMVTLSQPCINSIGPPIAAQHPDVQWDTTRQWAMFYTELENVGPTPVNFNSAQWQIAVKQSPIMSQNSAYYGTGTGTPGEMRLTLVGSGVQSNSTLPTLAAGSNTGGTSPRLTIGGMIGSNATASANGAITGIPFSYWNPNPTNVMVPAPSYMVLDPNPTAANGVPTNTGTDYQFPICPRAAYGTGATTPSSPWFGNTSILSPAMNGLDLIQQSQANNYWVVPPNAASPNADGLNVTSATQAAPGAQLLQFNDPSMQLLPGTAPVVLRIELRRRADPNRVAILPSDTAQVAEAQDNPWITVDYMDVPVSVMALKLTGSVNDFAPQIQGQLGAYFQSTWANKSAYQLGTYYQYGASASPPPNISTERSQPLYHDYTLNPWKPTTGAFSNGPFAAASSAVYQRNGGAATLQAPLWQGNSFGQDNDAADNDLNTTTPIQPHPLYQPHYDRDFSSIGELFNIPLYGQPQAPQWVASAQYHLGDTILPCYGGVTANTGGLTFVCTTAGTSGATSPTFPTTAPGTVGDGTVTWTAVSVSSSTAPGNSAQMFTGLTHAMASRVNESGAPVPNPATPPPPYPLATPRNPTPELLVGADYISADQAIPPFQHYSGYGTAGFRFQHPEGGNQAIVNPNSTTGASDFTENRWFRLLGLVEVPTRQHRGINEPNGVYPYDVAAGSINGSLGFYRTAGKININTLRYPDIVAGLVGEPDIFNMNFSAALPSGQNLPANLSVPYLLQDITGDTIVVPPPQNPSSGSTVRDWWEQFIATRDGVDPLPTTNGGTGLSIPGLPKSPANAATNFAGYPANFSLGSHPFRGLNYSAYGGVDTNGYNGPLESNALRSLSGDAVTPTTSPAPTNFDLRRRLFELGTNAEHVASNWDYATKQRLLSRLVGNTTTRSNVFFVWIQVDFFQAKDVGPSLSPADTGVVRIGAKLATSPAYRGFFVIDRSQALPLLTSQYLPATDPTTGKFVFSFNQSFNWQSLVLYQQRIQ